MKLILRKTQKIIPQITNLNKYELVFFLIKKDGRSIFIF